MSDLKITLPYITKIENIGIQPKTHGIEWFDSNDNSRGKMFNLLYKRRGRRSNSSLF